MASTIVQTQSIMKTVGIVTESKQLRYVTLSGVTSSPHCESDLKVIPYPHLTDSGAHLEAVLKTLSTLVSSLMPCKIVLLISLPGPTGKRSAERLVAETLIKLACHRADAECSLLHPNSLRAGEKRFHATTGGTPEGVFNSSQPFRPIISKEVHLTAWSGLEG
jgi:hypothetical protein